MTRYFNSFLITFVLYAGVAFAFFTIFADDKILVKKEKPLQKTISLKHIELMPIPKVEKKIEKVVEKKQEIKKEEPKKMEKKKEIKKKIVKKTPKKIEKKKVIKKEKKKKVVEKKKKVEKKIEKKVIEKKPISKPIIKETAKQKNITQMPKKVEVPKTDIKQDYLAKNLRLIRNEIKKNVRYPKSARRLNIQGVVRVKFTLHTNGRVDNIVILNGHSRLKKSTINAVKDAASSFPKVEKTITIELPIEYKLN